MAQPYWCRHTLFQASVQRLPIYLSKQGLFVLILRRKDRERTGSEKFTIRCFPFRFCCPLGRVVWTVIQLSDMNGHAMKAINALLFILTTGQGKSVKFSAQILEINQLNHVDQHSHTYCLKCRYFTTEINFNIVSFAIHSRCSLLPVSKLIYPSIIPNEPEFRGSNVFQMLLHFEHTQIKAVVAWFSRLFLSK